MTDAGQASNDVWKCARRGLALRCPACGRGRIFAGYLKQAEACSACGEPLGRVRADDGPAWATILLVGHLVSPVFFVFAAETPLPQWVPLAAVIALVLALTLSLLPRMKGLFIGVIWATGAHGEEARDAG